MKLTDSTERTGDPANDQRPPASAVIQFRHRKLICCLLLILITLALYNPVTRAPFLNYDDATHVTDNLHVRSGLTWNTVVWAFRTSEAADWHPITWMSHALDCQLFGLNPAGHHTINIFLHVANVVLLFLILASAMGLVWRSLIVAAFFALHPINVESVAWISERKDVLSMFFFLVALAAYGWYVRRPSVGRYLAVTFAYALGLMTKAQVITFPFALLLLDYWPLYRLGPPMASHPLGAEPAGEPARTHTFWKLVWEKAPWFALSAVSAVITMKVEAAATQAKLPLWIHFGNAAISYVRYLGKAFWPVNLALVYPHPQLGISIPVALLSAIAILALTAVAVIFRRRRPYFVGWFWFLGTLVPMIGLVQISIHSMADRYAYIPLLGIFVIVCWGVADLLESWHVPAAVPACVALAVLLALGFALHRQVGFWDDNLTLWTHTLEITQGNYTAEDSVGTALLAEGRVEEAVPHFQRARLLRPDDVIATLNLATYAQMRGDYPAALDGYAKVPRFTVLPSLRATARVNSGYAHYSLQQFDLAQRDFEAGLNLQPENSPAYRGLGLLAQRSGDIDGAIKNYDHSVELQPSPVGYLLLAQALELAGRAEAARAAQSQAGRMVPDLNDDIAAVKRLLAN